MAGLDRLTAKQGTVPEAQFKEPRPPPIPEGTDDDDWNDDDDDEHPPDTLQVNTPLDKNIVQVQLPAPDKTTTPIPLFPPPQTLAPPGAPVENAVDQMLEEDVVGLDRLTAKQGTVPEAQFKEPRPPPIPEGTDDDDWNDDDDDEHPPDTLQVNTPLDMNIVQVQLPAPDKTTTPIPLFPPPQTLAPPGAPVENADDQMLEEDVVGLDRLTAKQGTVTEAQLKEPRPPPIPEGTDDDDWNDDDDEHEPDTLQVNTPLDKNIVQVQLPTPDKTTSSSSI